MLNEPELVGRLQRGDRSAFEPLYNAYVQAASRTAYLITHSHAAAQDSVHDAFVEVLRSISTLREVRNFRPWFYRIVINKAKREVRPRSVIVVPFELDRHEQIDLTSVLPEEAVLASEEVELLLGAVHGLAEMYRTPIILRYYTELSDAEIGQIMDVPAGTIKSRLNYARKLLHEQLQTQKQGQLCSDQTAMRKERNGHG